MLLDLFLKLQDITKIIRDSKIISFAIVHELWPMKYYSWVIFKHYVSLHYYIMII